MKNMLTNLRDLIKPGEPVDSKGLATLKRHWATIYLALFMILDKKENKPLEHMKMKLAEANEAVITFFDAEEKKRGPHG